MQGHIQVRTAEGIEKAGSGNGPGGEVPRCRLLFGANGNGNGNRNGNGNGIENGKWKMENGKIHVQ